MDKNNCRITTSCLPSLSNSKGFTIVELMIVVAIIGILAAIAIPAYNGYITTSKKKSAESVLEQFPVLIESYRAENGWMCPTCNTDGTYTYDYTEAADGTENTAGLKITTIYPDFRAKAVTANVSLYHYQLIFTVLGGNETAKVTPIPQTGRGAPSDPIDPITYE